MASSEDTGPTRDEQVAAVRADFSDDERTMLVDTWVTSVREGRISRDDFEQALENAIGGGLINEEEANRGRAALA